LLSLDDCGETPFGHHVVMKCDDYDWAEAMLLGHDINNVNGVDALWSKGQLGLNLHVGSVLPNRD
jgi:hypothetical protein